MGRILLVLALAFLPSPILAGGDSLRTEIERIAGSVSGKVGVSIRAIEDRDTLTINGNERFPMQSVYKFPLALAILHEVDKGIFTLEQKIHVTKKDMLPNTWSPLREKYPQGNVDITLAELLAYTVSESDNNGCDMLFRLAGGTNTVERYIHGLGVENIAIATTEEEMHKAWEVQYRNWSTPAAMGQLLSMFYQGKILSKRNREFLWQLMVNTKTGPRRLKGLLPEGSIVAHKTGSSGVNDAGIVAATNDAGIVSLANGKHVVVVVLVTDAMTDEEACERIIAEIAEAAWDSYSRR
jgi:beta-lactamase class A